MEEQNGWPRSVIKKFTASKETALGAKSAAARHNFLGFVRSVSVVKGVYYVEQDAAAAAVHYIIFLTAFFHRKVF